MFTSMMRRIGHLELDALSENGTNCQILSHWVPFMGLRRLAGKFTVILPGQGFFASLEPSLFLAIRAGNSLPAEMVRNPIFKFVTRDSIFSDARLLLSAIAARLCQMGRPDLARSRNSHYVCGGDCALDSMRMGGEREHAKRQSASNREMK